MQYIYRKSIRYILNIHNSDVFLIILSSIISFKLSSVSVEFFFIKGIIRKSLHTCNMSCSLVCGSWPFFFLIIKKISPISGQLSSNLKTRTFPMNPVLPVTRTFLLANHSGIDFLVIFKKTEEKYLLRKRKRNLWRIYDSWFRWDFDVYNSDLI